MMILGTAQFGMDYGVTNSIGKVKLEEIDSILEFALKSGIQFIDTAEAYGDALEVLSKCKLLSEFKIISKLTLGRRESKSSIRDRMEAQLAILDRSFLDVLLVHNAEEIFGESDFECDLDWIKEEGLATKIGGSYYTPDTLERGLQRFEHGAIQVPFNIFDQRFEVKRLNELNDKGVFVMGRSAFLQGVLLSDKECLPHYFKPWEQEFDALDEISNLYRASKIQLCQSVYPSFMHLVFGCTSTNELDQIVQANRSKIIFKNRDLENLKQSDLNLILPSNWVN